MKNWKTTICGVIGAVGVAAITYIQTNPSQFSQYPWATTVAGILAASGIFGNGAFSKDATTHSTAAEVGAATTTEGDKQP